MRISLRTFNGLLLLCLLLVLGAMAGCQVVGFGAQAMFPPKVDAAYVPPKTAPLLILVENRQNPSMALIESDELTNYIIDDLKTYQVCPIVDPKKYQDLRDEKGRKLDTMSISQIGQTVGAEQVLYVDLKRSNIAAISGVPVHGRMDVAVKMVDVKTGKTVFPKNSVDAYPMTFETPLARNSPSADPVELRRAMLAAAGTRIGRLFHEWFPQGR